MSLAPSLLRPRRLSGSTTSRNGMVRPSGPGVVGPSRGHSESLTLELPPGPGACSAASGVPLGGSVPPGLGAALTRPTSIPPTGSPLSPASGPGPGLCTGPGRCKRSRCPTVRASRRRPPTGSLSMMASGPAAGRNRGRAMSKRWRPVESLAMPMSVHAHLHP